MQRDIDSSNYSVCFYILTFNDICRVSSKNKDTPINTIVKNFHNSPENKATSILFAKGQRLGHGHPKQTRYSIYL